MFKTKNIIENSVKDVDVKKGIVIGYFASFNTVDNSKDLIIPGAFRKSILERGANGKNLIFHLWQHETDKILSKPTILKEDTYGLYFESEIVKTSYGSDILKLYESGVINQHSVGYKTIKESTVTDNAGNLQYNSLNELKLYEGSTVTWGANENTPFLGMKSDITLIENLQKALKTSGLTDEMYQKIEIEIEKIKTLFQNMPVEIPQNQEKAVNKWDFLKNLNININK